MQLITNFVIPIFVLTKLSSNSALGPVKALILAITFPILYEVYNVVTTKKVSATSIIIIIGLLVTGLLGLLRISSFWLAIRRAVPYLFIVCVIVISHFINRSVLMTFLNQVLDLEKVEKIAKTKGLTHKLKKTVRDTNFFDSGFIFNNYLFKFRGNTNYRYS